MTKVFVIDPDARPSSDWRQLEVDNPVRPFDAGLRIMEAETMGWVSGRFVKMAVYGNTAMRPPFGQGRAEVVTERWQVFQQGQLGGWVAWVSRPKDEDRIRRDAQAGRMERIVIGVLILIAIGFLAIFMTLLNQGGLSGGLQG